MYHPLVWFEGRTGLLLRTRLRPGRDASAACVVEDLRHLLPPLRRRFPHTPIFLRGDAGMATPAVEAKLEAEGIRYVLGIGTNRVFKARVAGLIAKAEARHDRTRRPVHLRTSFRHRAKSWPHHRRILVKIDVTAQGLNVRFMVTNPSVFQVHLDHHARHRFGVPANQGDLLIRQCFGLITEQFTTARNRNRIGLVIRFFDELHGAPPRRRYMCIRLCWDLALQRAGLELCRLRKRLWWRIKNWRKSTGIRRFTR